MPSTRRDPEIMLPAGFASSIRADYKAASRVLHPDKISIGLSDTDKQSARKAFTVISSLGRDTNPEAGQVVKDIGTLKELGEKITDGDSKQALNKFINAVEKKLSASMTTMIKDEKTGKMSTQESASSASFASRPKLLMAPGDTAAASKADAGASSVKNKPFDLAAAKDRVAQTTWDFHQDHDFKDPDIKKQAVQLSTEWEAAQKLQGAEGADKRNAIAGKMNNLVARDNEKQEGKRQELGRVQEERKKFFDKDKTKQKVETFLAGDNKALKELEANVVELDKNFREANKIASRERKRTDLTDEKDVELATNIINADKARRDAQDKVENKKREIDQKKKEYEEKLFNERGDLGLKGLFGE